MQRSELLKINQSQRSILLKRWRVTSRPHRLMKTSSMQSKRHDLHHKWPHRETNGNTLLFIYGMSLWVFEGEKLHFNCSQTAALGQGRFNSRQCPQRFSFLTRTDKVYSKKNIYVNTFVSKNAGQHLKRENHVLKRNPLKRNRTLENVEAKIIFFNELFRMNEFARGGAAELITSWACSCMKRSTLIWHWTFRNN